ncbi:MAG: rod shape-determining protein MreC [Actinomycetota bacterium]|nr:rod shape-determining protein MreC [Actinomycetota bacterium]
MYRKDVRRRRTILVALIVVSLILLSIHFSEPRSGPLHTIQRAVATVLSPLEAVAGQALKPGRDLVNWFDDTFAAKGENEELRDDLETARVQLAQAQAAVGENEKFRELLGLDRDELAGFVPAFEPVTARVIVRSPTVTNATLGVNAGSGDGIEIDDPVVAAAGLVGRVVEVTSATAQVQLITDPRSSVSVKVLPDGPQGIVEPEVGDPDDLRLDFISNDDDISEGQLLVTAGWSNEEYSSVYPYGIPIGEVTETTLGDEDFQRITVRPFAEMRALQYVQVLTGGPRRPGIDE